MKMGTTMRRWTGRSMLRPYLGEIIIYGDNGLFNGGNHAELGTACCAATVGGIMFYGNNGY